MTEIYIVRHGETEGNQVMEFNGQHNTMLTETGYKQAELLGEYFKDKKVDSVYSSDLTRAYETAQPLSNIHNKTVIMDERLREINGGDWQGVKFTDLEDLYPVEYKVWLYDLGAAKCPGGESVKDVGERAFACLKEIAEENQGKSVVVVSHATPIRALITIISDGDISEIKNHSWLPNASVSKIIYENGSFRVEYAGETSHLQNLITVLPDNC